MSKKDDISAFHDYDLYIPTRTIYMGSLYITEDGDSGVDAHLAERVIKNLHILDNQSERGDKPITIIMNNPGGDWNHGIAIANAISKCKNHVTIIVYGMAMSMGSIILQMADERIVAQDADIMIHYGEDGFYGHPKTLEKWTDHGKRLNKRMEQIYIERIREKNPKYRISSLRKLLNFDTILSAKEAIELGLADKIL